MRDIDSYTEKYINDDFGIKYMVKYRRKKVLEIMQKHSPKNILEIGCGLQPIFKFYPDFKFYTIVEPSKSFAENALEMSKNIIENNNGGGGGTINIVNDFFEDHYKELEQQHFDFIICSGLLHEVEDPKKLLSAIFSVADQDSIIHINVPNAMSFHRLLALESGLISSLKEFSDRNKMMQQHSVFDLEDLKNLIVEIAFKDQKEIEILDSGSYFLKPFTHSQMAACLSNRIFGEQVLEGFYKIVKYMPELGCEIYANFKLKDIGG